MKRISANFWLILVIGFMLGIGVSQYHKKKSLSLKDQEKGLVEYSKDSLPSDHVAL